MAYVSTVTTRFNIVIPVFMISTLYLRFLAKDANRTITLLLICVYRTTVPHLICIVDSALNALVLSNSTSQQASVSLNARLLLLTTVPTVIAIRRATMTPFTMNAYYAQI